MLLQHQHHQYRSFHATRRTDIVPFLAVGAVTAYYSYRAYTRMESEWDDYRWQLAQYEKKRTNMDDDDDTTTITTTVAMDCGTAWTKLAATLPREQRQQNNDDNKSSSSAIQVLITPQGYRATFNGIVYDNNDHDDASPQRPVAVGKAALERFWFASAKSPSTDVVLPFVTTTAPTGDDDGQQHHVVQEQRMVQDVLSPILEGALDRVGLLDDSNHPERITRFRIVVTLPAAYYVPSTTTAGQPAAVLSAAILQAFPATTRQDTTSSTDDDDETTRSVVLVPEAVAAVWGAQQQKLLPLDYDNDHTNNNNNILVIDVGGWTTQVSLVRTRTDSVQHAVTIPWGGEHMVQSIVEQLLEVANDDDNTTNAGKDVQNDARALALLQLEARQVLTAFASQDRVNVLVPYLFSDPGNHNFETQLSRETFHRAVDHSILQQQQQHAANDTDNTSTTTTYLSSSMPPPKDLSSLWISALARVLEDAQIVVPRQELFRILVVGGGSNAVVVQESLRSAIQLLVGPSVMLDDDLLVWPDTMELSTELTVLGAASLPPSFDYSLTDGLVPR